MITTLACKRDVPIPEVMVGSKDPVEGIRIAWDYSSRQQLSPQGAGYSGYARMSVLEEGSWFVVYESEGHVHGRKSWDQGNTWSEDVVIAEPESGISATVPEVLQLQNGTVMVSYNMRPGSTAPAGSRFGIRAKLSDDFGATWSEYKEVYQAGTDFENGCWEPAQIQLPDGEIQLYIANEGPYTNSAEQEITMFSSVDNGLSWTEGRTISFRDGHRDGMPVPLILHDGRVVMSIEDNGIGAPEFKPVIIESNNGEWEQAPVSGSAPARKSLFQDENRIPGTKYAGAPYIQQLASGEVLLSYQSDEFRSRNQWDQSDMVVAIGDSDSWSFGRKSRPFYFESPEKTCLWNSIHVINDQEVVALGSTNAFSPNIAVWMIKGVVIPAELRVPRGVAPSGADFSKNFAEADHAFIGGRGSTNVEMRFSYNEKYLHAQAIVRDREVRDTDGITLFLDPQNRSYEVPAEGVFALLFHYRGDVERRRGEQGQWEMAHGSETVMAARITSEGYVIESSIPWSELGGRPNVDQRIGYHVQLHEQSATSAYTENLSGNQPNQPYTWSALKLTE
ncbi:exo-alpha-sialidase [Marinoscillum sp.]|uniref:exo-alpha-sialidase n=1 Tax=Marinoscillum sp. TaxID=2024838 RepID=UPI003BACFDB7